MESRKKLTYTIAGLILFFLVLSIVFSLREKKGKQIEFIENEATLGPIVAGTFYPANDEKLISWIDSFLAEAPQFDPGERRIFGLIVPHAGYYYSGRTAASAFRLLQGKSYDRIVVIAPCHHGEGAREVSIPKHGTYVTALGSIPIDQEVIAKLRKGREWITDNSALFEKEHSLEVELPFLQHILGTFRLVPIYVGSPDPGLARDLADALKEVIGEDALYIASTDLSHYHPYGKAQKIDRRTLDLITAKDPGALAEAAAARKCELCGLGPVLTLLSLFQDVPEGTVELIKYETSGDITGKKHNVVGYGALALLF